MKPDPRAPGLLLGEGVQIGERVSIGPYTILHEGVSIDAGASIGPHAVVGRDASIGAHASVGAHAVIHSGASVGAHASIGAHAVIHERTIVGQRCVVDDLAVLGKSPRLARHSAARAAEAQELAPLRLGEGVTICASAVVFAGAVIADQAIVGDQAYVRERSHVGPSSVVGRGSVIDNDVRIGACVKIQTNVYVTAASVVEDHVFIGPGVVTTNDDTMSRHGPETSLRGATLRRACRIGGGAVLTPNVEVGEEAFLAAGAVLTRDLPARAVAIGVPARVVREVGEQDLLERWR